MKVLKSHRKAPVERPGFSFLETILLDRKHFSGLLALDLLPLWFFHHEPLPRCLLARLRETLVIRQLASVVTEIELA